ncbi:Uncharacterised protein [Mycobacteroides abscessus subsp. abscessus]|uniref:hypothetical protein n=1 Tax=Mycobacteroides abscessus TaxID=36809 RepID=UPI0009B0CB95|nr:hypothetical protein [Mycobacteroides abscessus]SLL01463.1 Uncharacterised protein [Mycobacteroides abscessus subsp. abscessus]
MTTPESSTEQTVDDTTPVVDTEVEQPEPDAEADTFPRQVVEDLRRENGKYRQRAQQADTYAARLHAELVRATGKLADPTDLPFDAEHLDDPEKMVAAIDELLEAKPHLASRRPTGDIGQGQRGPESSSFSLLDTLKSLT